MKLITGIIVIGCLLVILCLAVLNSTVEGLSAAYDSDDLDVIYHTDPTRDYNILLKDVMDNVEIKNELSNDFPEIKQKIEKDPTILSDIRERLKKNIESAAKDGKSAKLEALIVKMEKSEKASNYINDKDNKTEKVVKDFRMLLDAVMMDTDINNIFENNRPKLDKIKNELNKNPQMLENARSRLKLSIDEVGDAGLTDDLLSKIENKVKTTEYIKYLALSDKLGAVTYNEPGYFRFGPSNYVPNYEDSVYLSRLTGLSYATPVTDTVSQLSGFCSFNKSNPGQTEIECNKMDKNTCGSTSCCVLLGGSKCVSGNESGPTMKSNFGDVYIKNKDHYYHQGKCYGNCP